MTNAQNKTVYDEKKLKLIYVLKVGYNSKNEGIYEFIFSNDQTKIDVENWCWDMIPACDNAQPPTEEYVDATISLKTSTFDLFCLHEAVDREYMHGYYTIHALAYEIEKSNENGYDQYKNLFENADDDTPLLVFHYGMTLENVKNLLYGKRIILKNDQFIETSSVKFQ